MENPIKCIAIDDEPLALDVIAKFCDRLGSIELQTFSDPEEGLAAVTATHPDILFLDIEMGDTSGLSLAARLPSDICLVFTTAYLHYAIEGFNLDAVDYLHKPFAFSRFETAVNKAMRRIGTPRPARPATRMGSIVVKQEYSNVTIPLDDILYVEAVERYSRIYRQSGGCTVTRILLKQLSGMLPADDFTRVHLSFILYRSKEASYTRQEIR
ncbi:MAG: DNA-binding response regulator, partial [Muribaculaceae bacterium]|nr:DNA-binding response regulator [Muribaculaceae bacterium]